MTDDTTGIPTAPEAVAERLRAETKRVQQADKWIGKLIGFGLTAMALGLLSVIVLASMLTRGPIAEHWRQTWNALGLALFIAGVATACSGLIISSARRRAQLARLEQAARHLEILAAIRDLPSVEDVYRVTAMQEATQLLVGQLQVQVDRIAAAGAGHAHGLTLLRADVQTLRDLQGDLERDVAALILGGKPSNGQVNGSSGGAVVSIRQLRPDGPG
jgi:hypothetical protein